MDAVLVNNLVRRMSSPFGFGIASLVLAIAVFALTSIAGNPHHNALFDFYQRLKPRDLAQTPVRVVLIDDLSLAVLGQWPWPRFYVARLVQNIGKGGPRVVGLNMIFPEPDRNDPANFAATFPGIDEVTRDRLQSMPKSDDALAIMIGDHPVVLGFAGLDGSSSRRPFTLASPFDRDLPISVLRFGIQLQNLQEFDEVALAHGFLNADADRDGVFRRVAPAARIAETDGAPFSLAMASQFASGERIRLGIDNGRLAHVKFGSRTIAVGSDDRVRPYLGKFPPAKIVSAADVIRGSTPPGFFKDSATIVATGATGIADFVPTSLSSQEIGGLVQAQMIDAFLAGAMLDRPDWAAPAEWAIGLVLAALALVLAPKIGAAAAFAAPACVALALGAASWFGFAERRLLIDPLLPLGLFLFTVAGLVIGRFVQTARARAHIHRAFDRYLSPELVDRIARDPAQLELGGEERDMTVLFCDVRGFSALSEKMRPQEIIQFLIGLLTPMTDILLAGRATIDKYVGDAIIAFWNAPLDDPHHARNAADSALAMIARLRELNAEMPGQDRYPWPGDVKIGIGLNAGPICVGNMGSERRLSYSMIGDTVNLASRIEGLTKYYGVEIAIGSELAGRLEDYAIVALDEVRVVGRSSSETIYALAGGPEKAQTAEFQQLRDAVDAAREAYLGQAWDEAETLFVKLSDGRFAKLASIHLDRIARYRDLPPPADWDGVYQATEK